MSKALTIVKNPDTLTPIGGPRKREPKLKTLRDIRTEMSRQYRACFYRQEMLPEDYSRAVFGLRALAEIIEATEFEERLQQLEGKQP